MTDLKIGDQVFMNDKYRVSEKNKNRLFTVRSEPQMIGGTECVFLEDYRGAYAADGLTKCASKKNGVLPGQIEMYFPPSKKYKIVGHYEDGEVIESYAIESYESAEKFKIGMERLTGDRATFEIVEVVE